MLTDTHCHLNFKDFKNDANEIIKKSLDNDIQVINVGAEWRSSERAVEYAERYNKGVYAVVGLHPIHIKVGNENQKIANETSFEEFNYEKYLELAQKEKVVAIGEVGLDYHHFCVSKHQENETDKGDSGSIIEDSKKNVKRNIEKQKEILKKFINLANEVNKPLVLHCWGADKKDKDLVDGANAYNDLLKILEQKPANSVGVIHSFIGGLKIAKKFIALGFKIGLNGIITYSNSYDKLIKNIGLENILLETDAPYLTPMPLERYSRNEPLNVRLVAGKIANVLGIDIKKVEEKTTVNAKKLFDI